MSAARFQIYQDRKGEWRWRLRARNSRIIADSGEGYSRRRDVDRAIKNVFAALRTLGR